MEIFTASLGIMGIISLFGACAMIFRAGSALLQAQEVLLVAVKTHSDTMKALADFRETTDASHKQIQEWILETQSQIETSEAKSENIRDFCAKRYVTTEKRMEAIESTFKLMSGNVDIVN